MPSPSHLSLLAFPSLLFFSPSISQPIFSLAFLFFSYSLFFSVKVAFKIYVVNVDLCNNQHQIEYCSKLLLAVLLLATLLLVAL